VSALPERGVHVLLVDDHPLARRGLRVLTAMAFPGATLADAGDAEEARRAAAHKRPDLVLLDLRMPGSEPADVLCAALLEIAPRAAIVLITAFDELNQIRACLAAGARGCLLKDVGETDLAGTLHRALAGENVLDERIARRLADEYVGVLQGDSHVTLTPRERAVLRQLAEGSSNRAIAATLHLSENTVKGYVAQLMGKLDASSRWQAVVNADRLGLL
jgi:DNA-binding NarL/FixJ family response regulator